MRISSISSASNSTYRYSSGNKSNLKQIENQLKKLEQQIVEENQNKDDAEIKQTKVKLYETQIGQFYTEQQNNNYFIGNIIDIQV